MLAFSRFGRRSVDRRRLGFKIFDDHRNAAIGRVFRVIRLAQAAIGEATHLSDLAFPQTFALHQAAGHIGAVGR